MTKFTKGYTRQHNQTRMRLKNLNLPDTLFDADFKEKEEQNKRDLEMLLERLRERERNGAYEGLELPWSDLRKQFEEDAAAGEEQPYIATQSAVPKWKHSFDQAAYIWHSETDQAIKRMEKKKKKGR